MGKLQISIDRGGTFTDALGRIPGERDDIVVKLLSHDPNNYKDAPREAVRRIVEIARGTKIARGDKIETHDIGECFILSLEHSLSDTCLQNTSVCPRPSPPMHYLSVRGKSMP